MRALPASPEDAQDQAEAAGDLADPACDLTHARKTIPADQPMARATRVANCPADCLSFSYLCTAGRYARSRRRR